ncbi:restriction endonuclease subunit S [Gordonia iterans]|nr:hypothetical protein [Gordonia iterans]
MTKFGDLLSYPLRSGVTVAASARGSGIRMVNMRELFAHRQLGDVDMARVELGDVDEERYLLRSGDLLFARRSLTAEGAGQCAIVAKVPEPTTWESSILRARVDTAKSDPTFLYYYFRSPQGRRLMATIVEQVAAAGIRSSDLGRLDVPCPSLDRQYRVAEVLGALDDKIAANRYVADRCDLLRSELWQGAILAGARLEALSTVARFVNGRAFTKDATGTGRVVVRIAELNSGIGSSTVYNDIEVADDNTVRPGDLLMAWSGSLVTRRWFRDEAIVNQHIFKVISDQGYPHWAVACAVESQMPYFRSLAADKATTMGHIQRHHLDDPVAWPETINAELNALGEMLWQRALAAETESERLARTRDELLPLLMDGRISVRQAADTAARVL